MAASLVFAGAARAEDAPGGAWQSVLDEAKGETVYFDAWGGSQNINDYIAWVGEEVKQRFGVTLQHVKLDDTASAVATVVAEKAAGKDRGGSIDLIWINGENFVAMQEQGLLADGFATELPNWRYVDTANPSVTVDFTVPTKGQESPWGGAKLVFFSDTARSGPVEAMPKSADELLTWAKAHPGRFSYPAPPDFIGSSFLKQVLIETTADPAVLQKPVEEADFETVTKPLWDWLDAIQPVLWRSGRDHPQNYPAMKQLLADGELEIIFAFNPAEASSAIAAGELPDTVRSFTFPGGTLGNTHFVAIPYNSSAKAAAKVVADFLISPEAQLRKEDPRHWGDPTVLAMDKLPEDARDAFAEIDRGIATLPPSQLGPVLAEPHSSWMTRIEEEWKRRYGG
ncbi:ABC transporter substrate-binding protein [Jiella avicenniae]|uniref:ABC transporter substrate-binding protein n=1 Tax=Jiella avicenniae TaxID=2907202 RepID=A0A9X1TDK4_9HYPH|nr:ABC transporter substrate-binding protein [Jiella avicenniae]